jgi:hypothetical protein
MPKLTKILVGAAMAIMAAAPAHAALLWGNNAGFGPDVINAFDPGTGALVHTYSNISGNGRGIVVVNDIVYYTVVGDGVIHEMDANTGLALPGSINTGQSSLSTISFDGTNFWLADYSGTNQAYLVSQTGALLKTIHLANATGNTDGLEYFNGKLIANRGDAESIYDIYDLDGNVLTANFIASGQSSTGIAFDGTNFYTSNVFGNSYSIWNGLTGAFIKTTVEQPGSGYLIEDLSFDFAGRVDTCGGVGQPVCNGGGTPVPEPLTLSLFSVGLIGVAALRRRGKKNSKA